jgi:hypothetical protein
MTRKKFTSPTLDLAITTEQHERAAKSKSGEDAGHALAVYAAAGESVESEDAAGVYVDDDGTDRRVGDAELCADSA